MSLEELSKTALDIYESIRPYPLTAVRYLIRQKWVRLEDAKDAVDEVYLLIEEYALEDDEKLSKDAIKLKNEILDKIPKLKEMIKK